MLECDGSDSLTTRRKGSRLTGACCSEAEEPMVLEVLSVAFGQVHRLREMVPAARGVEK